MLVSDTPEILEYHIGKSAARKNGLHDSDAVIVKTDKFGRPVSFVFDGCTPAFDATIFIDAACT